jgi:PAS domain S-box-containing protein
MATSEQIAATFTDGDDDIGIAVVREGELRYVNGTLAATLGVTREDLLGESLASYVGVEDSGRFEQRLAAGEGGILGRTEMTLETAGGERIPAVVDGVVRTASSDPATLLTVRDVTERRERERELERYRKLVEAAADAIFVADAESGLIVECNRGAERLLGKDREEIVGMHQTELHPQEKVEEYMGLFEEHVAGGEGRDHLLDTDPLGKHTPIYVVDDDGERVPVEINARTLEVGGQPLIEGLFRDISERKERERELLQYRTLVETAGDPMYVLDAEGNVELLNEAMAMQLGADEEALVGTHVSEALRSEDHQRMLGTVADLREESDRTWATYETRMTRPDGEQRHFEVTVGVIRNVEDEFVGSVGTFRDVTERERREQELALLKQLLSRFLRHNLRNDISIIESNAEVIADAGGPEDAVDSILDQCDDIVDMAEKARVVETIADRDPGRIEHEVTAVVDDAVASVETAAGATVDVAVETDATVLAIPELERALRNLVENAVEHGAPPVEVRVTADAHEVTVEVVDDGPGIPGGEVAVLEEGQETALEHGSGMGLWLIDWVVEKSGGDLAFRTDDGTRAVVTLERPER